MFIQVNILNIYVAHRIVLLDFAHTKEQINCVRWDPKGERLVSASDDKTVNIINFASGKVYYTSKTCDGGK